MTTTASLTVTKTAASLAGGAVRPGDTLTYTITILNEGDTLATGVVISDTFPVATHFIDHSIVITPAVAGGTAGDAGTQPVIASGLSVAAGSTVTVTYVVTVDSALADGAQIVNTASVTSSESSSPVSSSVVTAVTREADLAISKSGDPDPVRAGEVITYTLVVTNYGPSDAAAVEVTDTLPAGVGFVSAEPAGSCGLNGGQVICDLGDLAAGGSAAVTIRGNVASGATGLLANEAEVDSATTDPATGNNTASINIPVQTQADLAISKSGDPDPVRAGEAITYRLVVTNHGPSDAAAVEVTDTLPAGVGFVSAEPAGSCGLNGVQVVCNLGSLAKGGSTTVTILAAVNAWTTGTLENEAVVSGSVTENNVGNNTASVITSVTAEADLVISKSDGPDPVLVGDQLTYTLIITNNGPADAAGVTVTDSLPASVSFGSASGGCSHSAGTVTCNLGAVAKNATRSVSIVVVPSNAGTATNNATVSSATADPNGTNNSATESSTVHPKADLQIQKGDAPDPVIAGENLTYSLTVINKGPSSASGVTVVDTLPAGVSYTSVTSSKGTCSHSGGQVTCNLGSLLKEQSVTINILVAVNPTTTGTLVNTATVTGSAADPQTANNTASQSTTVQKPPIRTVYLPLALKPSPTLLSVHNDNTGGPVQFTVLGTGVSCSVLNNEVKFCGSFPAGTYSVQVVTSTCGSDTFVRAYGSGPETTRVFCVR